MRFIVTILFIVFCLQLSAQDKISVSNIKLSYDKVSEELNINYDLLPANSNAQFKIIPEVYYSNGQKIFASSFTGEGIETFTQCGNSKIIRWKPKQDNVKGLNENIYVVLNVNREIRISTGSHLLKSAILPGWGDYKLSNSWYYAGFGIVAYGAVSGAVLYNRMAANTYNNYKNSMDINQSNKLLSDAKNQQKISNILAISSAAIWAIDLARVYIKSQKVKKEIKSSNYYFDQSNQTFSNKSSNFWLDNRTDFEKNMEFGKQALRSNSYKEALSYFNKSNVIKPNDTDALMGIKEAQQKIDEENAKEDKYQSIIKTADSLFNTNQLLSAKTQYLEAAKLKPKDLDTKDKIKNIDEIIENNRVQKEYNNAIEKADNFFKLGNLTEAESNYNIASAFKPNEVYPKNKLIEIDSKIKENEFKTYLQKGKNNFQNKKYEDAIDDFNKAIAIKPENTDAKNWLSKVNQKIEEIKEIENQKFVLESFNQEMKNGIEYYNNGEYKEALAEFNYAKHDANGTNIKIVNDWISKTNKAIEKNQSIYIPLISSGNCFKIKVKLNGTMTFDFIFDTGADNVTVSPDIFTTFYKGGLIKDNDIKNLSLYNIANGSSIIGLNFIIRKLEIGELIFYDVSATVLNSKNYDNLLGGNVFKKIGKITLDYDNNMLIINKK